MAISHSVRWTNLIRHIAHEFRPRAMILRSNKGFNFDAKIFRLHEDNNRLVIGRGQLEDPQLYISDFIKRGSRNIISKKIDDRTYAINTNGYIPQSYICMIKDFSHIDIHDETDLENSLTFSFLDWMDGFDTCTDIGFLNSLFDVTKQYRERIKIRVMRDNFTPDFMGVRLDMNTIRPETYRGFEDGMRMNSRLAWYDIEKKCDYLNDIINGSTDKEKVDYVDDNIKLMPELVHDESNRIQGNYCHRCILYNCHHTTLPDMVSFYHLLQKHNALPVMELDGIDIDTVD